MVNTLVLLTGSWAVAMGTRVVSDSRSAARYVYLGERALNDRRCRELYYRTSERRRERTAAAEQIQQLLERWKRP